MGRYIDEVPRRTKDFTISLVRAEVRLTADDWDTLQALDQDFELSDKMREAGAYELDHNGHFGCRIILEAESHAKIVELIDYFFDLIDKA